MNYKLLIIILVTLILTFVTGIGSAASGDGKMKVEPANVNAGSIGNNFIFTFNNNKHSFGSGSQATITIPSSWTSPQKTNSAGNGYVSVLSKGATLVNYDISGQTIIINFETNNGKNKDFTIKYNNVEVPKTSGRYAFLTKTKKGTGSLKNIKKQPVVTVESLSASFLVVSDFPSPVTAGNSGSFRVIAKDEYGNTATGYTGKIHFTSSDINASLPKDHKFKTKDKGIHSFNARFKTEGIQWLAATDAANPLISGSQTGIQVIPPVYTHTLTLNPKVGDKVKDTVTSTSTSGNKMQFTWIRPNGFIAQTKLVTRHTYYKDSIKPDMAGIWNINVKEFDSKKVQLGTSSTTFTVTENPEFGTFGVLIPLFAVSFMYYNFRKRFYK